MNPNQLVLAGFQLPASKRDRRWVGYNYFLAAQPDADASTRILNAVEPTCVMHRLQNKLFAPERLHVSLAGVVHSDHKPNGSFANFLRWLCLRVSQVTLPPFDVRFHHALSFGKHRATSEAHPYVLVGDTDGFQSLRAALLHSLGLNNARYHFTPHMTLLYDNRIVPKHEIPPVNWTVNGFSLIQSHVGQHRYAVLGSWPLRNR